MNQTINRDGISEVFGPTSDHLAWGADASMVSGNDTALSAAVTLAPYPTSDMNQNVDSFWGGIASIARQRADRQQIVSDWGDEVLRAQIDPPSRLLTDPTRGTT